MAGTKLVLLFGGGFCPLWGPSGKSTTIGWGKAVKGPTPSLRIVEPLPDSKMATQTFVRSGLTAIALGRWPSIAIELNTVLATGSNTCTVLAPAQETKARSGVPAKTTSAGASSVLIVATIRIALRSSTLTESET